MRQIPNGNFFAGRWGARPRWIVLHGTAGGTSAAAIANYFKSTEGSNNAVSSHYVIGQDGEVVQCVDERDGAWANGVLTAGHAPWWPVGINPNNVTISIEHCKPSPDNSDQLTPQQQAASFQLIKEICERWDIPRRQADGTGGITGHFSLDPVNRARCPGPYPWSELWRFLQGGGMLENYFDFVSDEIWKCKQNGLIIGHAILDFYKNLPFTYAGLTDLGLPLTNETGIPGSPGVVLQRFERGVLIYDPQHKVDNPPGAGAVYKAHIDQGPGQVQQTGQEADYRHRLEQIHFLSTL